MNLCILSGKVINEIDLRFLYNPIKKSLEKRHISIIKIILELENKQIIELHAYNEIADFVYRNVQRHNYIIIQGKLRDNYIEIEEIEFINSFD